MHLYLAPLLALLVPQAVLGYGKQSPPFTLSFPNHPHVPLKCRGKPVYIDWESRYLGCFHHPRTDVFNARIGKLPEPVTYQSSSPGIVFLDTPRFNNREVLQLQGFSEKHRKVIGYPLRVSPPRKFKYYTYEAPEEENEDIDAFITSLESLAEPKFCLYKERIYFDELELYDELFGNVPVDRKPPSCARVGGSKNFHLEWTKTGDE
ncbi:hypothetical protein EX30DRAFT_392384 [Ascodesmis nigricans]|uniref:Ig-like domain-containing protein n=1 Tax=Ascodesmis nigricans TaxID=341454 RepID=A0A4S2N6S5_9PEZI|nr:hypothetical protein EX30DRAFT_392384 [Ascodesmis nigricans]